LSVIVVPVDRQPIYPTVGGISLSDLLKKEKRPAVAFLFFVPQLRSRQIQRGLVFG